MRVELFAYCIFSYLVSFLFFAQFGDTRLPLKEYPKHYKSLHKCLKFRIEDKNS